MSKIKITLCSDLCTGSGESKGNTIDIDIAADRWGLPYIPARRLKGCLREAAEYLEKITGGQQFDYDGKQIVLTGETIKTLFGTAEKEGCIAIHSAYPEGVENMRAYLDFVRAKDSSEPECLKINALSENITRIFTYVRGNTSINEDGTAEKGSLRYTRVLKRTIEKDGSSFPLVFNAEIMLSDDQYKEEFACICKALRHIGTRRSRGLGNVEAEAVYDNEQNTSSDGSSTCTDGSKRVNIEYRVKLDAPLTMPGCAEMLSAVPARSVIGCMASAYLKSKGTADEIFRRLFLTGDTCWSALTPVSGGKRSAPAPLMLSKLVRIPQNARTYINKYDPNVSENELKAKQKALDGSYACETSDGYSIVHADTDTSYHIGNPWDMDNRKLYTQAYINEGVIYGGIVSVPCDLEPIVRELMKTAVLRFGKSKNAEYAACSLACEPKSSPELCVRKAVKKGETLYAVLQSDLVLIKNGVLTADVDDVRSEIGSCLNVNVECPDDKNDYCLYHTIGGYNVMWHLQKPQIEVLCGGSILCFTAGSDCKIDELLRLGEYRSEGFGEIKVYTAKELEQKTDIRRAYIDTKAGNATPGNASPVSASREAIFLAGEILLNAALDSMRGNAMIRAESIADKLKNLQVSRIRQMLDDAESLEDLKGKANRIKDKNKKEDALRLLRNIYGKEIDDHFATLDSQLLEIIQSNNAVKRKITKSNQWKTPLRAAIKLLEYRSNKQGGASE